MESGSIQDLFAALKQAGKPNGAGSAEKTTFGVRNGETDFDQDKLEFDEDPKMAQQKTFYEIEQHLRSLPRMQTGFDALSKSESSPKAVQKLDDPVSILHLRKKDATTKKPSTTEQWFTIPKPELTRELKRDLLVLKHRAALDPKRHYKKDKWQLPERFSVGTIVEDKSEFFSSRMKNKERKSTMLGTLMGSDDTNKYFKRKYTEVQAKKTSGAKGYYKKVKDKRKKM
ncbi:LANO_0B02762g1_1 [Lachancea nothofagi CBS 11611]|uniref:LANO_0B02762g1_1 n=1 Tax=Lachancea nothofagi CBS 11611 TaxID=1266666 RepID=A0A1G4IWA0_9SACH|nr:LANO_0B02762g1_1 [Lachancea nothofagi CBS 11611]